MPDDLRAGKRAAAIIVALALLSLCLFLLWADAVNLWDRIDGLQPDCVEQCVSRCAEVQAGQEQGAPEKCVDDCAAACEVEQ